jgi:ribonuclease HI
MNSKLPNGFRPIRSLYVNIDGASKGNPGPAAIAIIVKDNYGKILEEYKEFIGKSTNNSAEYKAAIRALEIALKYCRNKVYLFTDSKLLVNQLLGKYRIRKKSLLKLLMEIKMLERFFKKVYYFHIAREKNVKADALVKSTFQK